MAFGFFGFKKVELDTFDFNLDDDVLDLDVSVDAVFVDPLPDPAPSPSFGGVFLGFGGFVSGGGSLNGSLSAGVSDSGDTYAETSVDHSGFWF